MRVRTFVVAAALSVAGTLSAGADDYSGFIVDTAGSLPRRSSNLFTLHVDQYTPIEEAQKMADLLLSQGTEPVLKELRKLDHGYIKIGSSLGYHVGLIRSLDAPEGGRVIRAVTDRPIQMFELMRDTRSSDYEFGLVELKLGADGKGEGQLIAAAKVTIDKSGKVEVESLGTRPFAIKNVKTKVKKEK
jgi:hypothetical protein